MTAPKNKDEYWQLVYDNWTDLLDILYSYLPMNSFETIEEGSGKIVISDKRLAIVIEQLKADRDRQLVRYFNAAFFAAPDVSSIHSIKRWHILCDLCSEEWCLDEDIYPGG